MRAQVVREILGRYGLALDRQLPTQKGYRNESHPVILHDGRRANLILYKHEPHIAPTIRRLNQLSSFLANQGLAVRAPLDPRIVKLAGRSTRYVGLYAYLPGETIPWESYTRRHIKLLGLSLSNLHAALRHYPQAHDLPRVTDVYTVIVRRMVRYFADSAVRAAMADKLSLDLPLRQLQRQLRLIAFCADLDGQQALHMDFVRSNILFFSPAANEFGLAVSGILDLEKAAFGHPLFDIARTLAFLIVDCKYKTEAQVRRYFLHSGYDKRGLADLPRQMRLLEQLINTFLLYDFYKFLRHNPYEYLAQNEHFVRTRDLLLERGVITTTTRYG